MDIQQEIQSLSPSAVIDMFVLDTSKMEGGSIFRFHPGTSQFNGPITWQGETYNSLPLEVEGFDRTSSGQLPRPKLRVANVEGLFSAMIADMDDLIGCKVTRKRTMARYLDAVNFKGGNPEANPMQEFPDEMWFIDQKVSENKHVIEWELASAFDLQGVMLPFRQVIQNSCCWEYRGPECRYDGPLYTITDIRTWFQSADVCSKRLESCKKRFGNDALLPFGGFPGANRGI